MMTPLAPDGARLDFATEMSYGDYLHLDELRAARSRMWIFTNSGSRDDISAIVRRQTTTGEQENGQFVQRNAARGG